MADILPFLLVLVVSLVLSLLIRPRRVADMPARFETIEAIEAVTASWLLVAALAALPFYLGKEVPSYTHAFFESMSGLTTTGATVIADVESMAYSHLIWRSFIQWLGGMGIILLFIAVLPAFGGSFSLFRAEIPGGDLFNKFLPRFKVMARNLWVTYTIITALEFTLLLAAGMSPFDALCHSFTTMATGGFSTKNAGVAAFGSMKIELVLIVFMILAGMNFGLHTAFLKGRWRAYFGSIEVKVYFAILGTAVTLIALQSVISSGVSPGSALRHAAFQATSIMTTTGYASDDFARWPEACQAILLILMCIGGCTGSTAGSVKVVRYSMLFAVIRHELRSLADPFRVKRLVYGGEVVQDKHIRQLLLMLFLFALTFSAASLLLTFVGVPGRTALSGAITCLANTGPGLGRVGPFSTYAGIPASGLWILSLSMLVGRLEVVGIYLVVGKLGYRILHRRGS